MEYLGDEVYWQLQSAAARVKIKHAEEDPYNEWRADMRAMRRENKQQPIAGTWRQPWVWILLALTVFWLGVLMMIPACARASDLTKNFEGFSEELYIDSLGNETIGYGFCVGETSTIRHLPEGFVLGESKLPRAIADEIFRDLYDQAKSDAVKFMGADVFRSLPAPARESLIDISYQLGYPQLAKFRKFKKALIARDFTKAARELKDSRWYYQSGRRSKYHVRMFKNLKGGAS